MSERSATSLAWASAAVTLGLVVSGAAIDSREFGLSAVVVALALVFAAVGALIASRHPANAIVAETSSRQRSRCGYRRRTDESP